MIADSIDISALNAGQRVALMERLWHAMADYLERLGPPSWHEAELESRQQERALRESVAEDWPTVREGLGRELL